MGNVVAGIEQQELEAHREQCAVDTGGRVGKYRSIFEWDVPDVDTPASDQLIPRAIHQTLDALESSLSDSVTR